MKDIIWILKAKKRNIDITNLVVKISNNQDINLSDFEIHQVQSIVHSFKNEIIEYLLENGFSSLVNSEILLEHIVTKGTSDDKIIPIVQLYLDKINIDKELIIIDPYFFAKKPKNPNYLNVFEQILDKYISKIESLIIVTSSHNVDTSIKNKISKNLKSKNKSLIMKHNTNNDYHDRFWISGAREKGIVMGTSLNSFGNKVALLDRLNIEDVKSVIAELKKDSLI